MAWIRKLISSAENFIFRKESTEYFWNLRTKSLHAKNRLTRMFYYYKYRQLMLTFGCGIPLNAAIEGMPIFPHGLRGIYISQGATIGKNVVIFQYTTIGSNTLTDSKHAGAPTIKDNVFIGAGAKVIGKITVGSNVRIGANAVVVKDVPDNATVILSEPRVIHHDKPRNNAFILYSNLGKE